MAGHWWKTGVEGTNLETFGFVHAWSESMYLISPVGVVTYGFVWRLNDIWENWDNENVQAVSWTDNNNIQNVTWTACDCSEWCD